MSHLNILKMIKHKLRQIKNQLVDLQDVKTDALNPDDKYNVDISLDRKFVITSKHLRALQKGKILVISPEINNNLKPISNVTIFVILETNS